MEKVRRTGIRGDYLRLCGVPIAGLLEEVGPNCCVSALRTGLEKHLFRAGEKVCCLNGTNEWPLRCDFAGFHYL